jgi:hypothetical protein
MSVDNSQVHKIIKQQTHSQVACKLVAFLNYLGLTTVSTTLTCWPSTDLLYGARRVRYRHVSIKCISKQQTYSLFKCAGRRRRYWCVSALRVTRWVNNDRAHCLDKRSKDDILSDQFDQSGTNQNRGKSLWTAVKCVPSSECPAQ